jgi:hypothetical protein
VLTFLNPHSISSNKEVGGWVYGNLDGSFRYADVTWGTSESIPGFPAPQSGYAAWFHAHGAYEKGYAVEIFSTNDMNISISYGVVGYLGTPSGAIKKYTPGDEGGIGKPISPKCPE